MIKQLGIASLLSVSLSAGCAADTGSYGQDLSVSDVAEQSERCTRQLGDFDGTTTPPPITIPIGQVEISAQDAIDEGQNSPNDPRAGLLAEYATLIINIDAGADLGPGEIDLLVLAEDLLVHTNEQPNFGPELADTLVQTISLLDELNYELTIEVPCQQNIDQLVVDAPPATEASIDRRGLAPTTVLATAESSDTPEPANTSFDSPDTLAAE